MKSAAIILVLGVSAYASPVQLEGTSSNFKRQDDAPQDETDKDPNAQDGDVLVWDDYDTFCRSWDFRSTEGAKEAWYETGAGGDVDSYIRVVNEGNDRWLKNYEDWIFKGLDGRTEADGCAVIGGNCNPGRKGWDCEKYFNEFSDNNWGKNAYWVFQAVRGANAKLTQLNRKFTEETLIGGLKIDKMAEEFKGNDEDLEGITTWISAAITMAGAVSGFIPVVGPALAAGLSITGALFGQLTKKDDPKDHTGDIKSALGHQFEQSRNLIEATLSAAMGAAKSDGDYESLPAPEWDTYETEIGKFFNGGWWLLEDDEKLVTDVINAAAGNIQLKVADQVIGSTNYLVHDTFIDKAEDCMEPGFQWMNTGEDDKRGCFHFMRDNDQGVPTNVDSEFYVYMEKYGLGNRDPYYRALIDCARSDKKDKKSAELGKNEIGTAPLCFFNAPVRTLQHDKNLGTACDFSSFVNCDGNVAAEFPL